MTRRGVAQIFPVQNRSWGGNRPFNCAKVYDLPMSRTSRNNAIKGLESVKYRKLSVIVPVFNERNTVVEILRRMRNVKLPDGLDLEILVVDDGSTDGTREVLSQLGDSTVRVLLQASNQGKGAALRVGFAQATGDLVLVQDADLEYDPEDWPKMLDPVLRGKAHVVYGSRFTGERRNMLFLHWIDRG